MRALREFVVDRRLKKADKLISEAIELIADVTPRIRDYHEALKLSREDLASTVTWLYSQMDRRLIVPFLMYFTKYGYDMTKPVEGWIRGAGQACMVKGYSNVGLFLLAHAKEEAGHEMLMKKDLEKLIELFNSLFDQRVEFTDFFGQKTSEGPQQYIELHEECITGPYPFQQIAIESEIEYLSLLYGPQLIGYAIKEVGFDISKRLSFVTSHVGFDIKHSSENFRAMGALLEEHPQAFPPLVEAGKRALYCYSRYIRDCMGGARRFMASVA
jgi:hypothetical protein